MCAFQQQKPRRLNESRQPQQQPGRGERVIIPDAYLYSIYTLKQEEKKTSSSSKWQHAPVTVYSFIRNQLKGEKKYLEEKKTIQNILWSLSGNIWWARVNNKNAQKPSPTLYIKHLRNTKEIPDGPAKINVVVVGDDMVTLILEFLCA